MTWPLAVASAPPAGSQARSPERVSSLDHPLMRASLVTERLGRIDRGGAPRWEVSGQDTHGAENRGGGEADRQRERRPGQELERPVPFGRGQTHEEDQDDGDDGA